MKTFVGAISCVALAATSSLGWADTITIRADSWCPMNCEPGSEKPGYMIEFAREIAEKHGHTVDYKTMPWKRAVESVDSGQFDCVVGAYKEDAPGFLFPDANWGLDQTAVYARSDSNFQYRDLSSFLDQKVGVIGGYAYTEEFDVFAQKNPSVVQGINADNALENNIRKVMAGRISLTLESPPVMGFKLKEMGLQGELKRVGYLDASGASEMYIACSPNSERTADYVTMFNEGTQWLRDSGRLAEILDQYGMEDWQ